MANARPGYDFTYSPPKSVSALWARTGDGRIAEAFQAGVLDTLREDVEPAMKTRLRRRGQDGDAVTGNLSPPHAEGRASAVREELRARGRLGPVDRTLVRYESKDLTAAQRKDPRHYQAGDTVQWGKAAPGFRPGERLTVAGCEGGVVRVRAGDGAVKDLPL